MVLRAAPTLPKGKGRGPWAVVSWNEPQGGCVRIVEGWVIAKLVPVYACGFDGVAIRAIAPEGDGVDGLLADLRAEAEGYGN